jgi:hypothetical protein
MPVLSIWYLSCFNLNVEKEINYSTSILLAQQTMFISRLARIEEMNDMISSLVIGFLLASSSFWLIAFINDSYTHREKKLARLLLKRGKKDEWLRTKSICAARSGIALQLRRCRVPASTLIGKYLGLGKGCISH